MSWNTVKDWFKPHMAMREPYAGFVAAVNEARAKWAAATTMHITKAGKTDWRAAAWMLEKLCPDEFSSSQKVDMTVRSADLSDADVDKRLAELALKAVTGGDK